MAQTAVLAKNSFGQNCLTLYWTFPGTFQGSTTSVEKRASRCSLCCRRDISISESVCCFDERKCLLFCLDDKHRIKVGDPNIPVAAAERGRCVLIAAGSQFLVADHDFTTFSIIPSVILHLAIPNDISGSWYNGEVFVGLKDGALEPSSPVRHMAELFPIAKAEGKPILFLYSEEEIMLEFSQKCSCVEI